MIDIIAGAKGKGKTKILIQQVNDDIKLTKGTIVYLDKNNKHGNGTGRNPPGKHP